MSLTGDHALCSSSRQRERGCVMATTLRAGLVGCVTLATTLSVGLVGVGRERGVCVSLTGDHA